MRPVAVAPIVLLLIGFSRLYLGVHYPAGVLAGYLVAAPWIGSEGIVLPLRGTRIAEEPRPP